DAERAAAVVTNALETAETLGDLAAQGRALVALSPVFIFRGDYVKAQVTAERLDGIADRVPDPLIRRAADRLMGIVQLNIGKPRQAQRHLERVLQPRRPTEDRDWSPWYLIDHSAINRALLARALWLQGFVERARHEAQTSAEAFQRTDARLMI